MLAIRRLRLAGLAPRDHPSPDDLAGRLADAARALLAPALTHAASGWSGPAVMRISRLEVDITLDASFEPEAFATLLAGSILAGLRRAEERNADGAGDGVVCFPTRAAYLAALLEALAERRAARCWWLRDADGLRFLSPGAAIRTAVLADAAVGQEALASLPPLRLAIVLGALGEGEAERALDGLATISAGGASAGDCIAAIAAAAEPQAPASPLALYLRAATHRPSLAGAELAATARLWAVTETALVRATLKQAAAGSPEAVGGALARAVAHHRARSAPAKMPAYVLTRFGGLLLLLPGLGMADIAATTADWPDAPADAAALIGYAALGLCAGRARFAEWLAEPFWREAFGLDVQAPSAAITDRLGEIEAGDWASLAPFGAELGTQGDARFLLAPRSLVGSRAATRTLAGLARAASARFARRLAGFGAASAPFLWANVLGISAALQRDDGGWEARLSRPPLDVLLSLSRIAEGCVRLPSGARVRIARATP